MIKINYSQSGSISEIFLQINDYWVQIPWDTTTQSIEWSSIDYQPTLDSIQSAWNAWAEGKDLSIELRDRPDLAPTQPKPQPSWSAFNVGLLSLPAYNNLMAQSPGYLSANLSVTASQFATGSFNNYSVLKMLWDAIVIAAANKPSAADLVTLNQLAQQNNMLFSFGSDGKLVLS